MWSVLHESPSLLRHKIDEGIAQRFIMVSSERHRGPATSIHYHRPHTHRKTPPRVGNNSSVRRWVYDLHYPELGIVEREGVDLTPPL